MAEPSSRDQLLTLKVMRLTRPTFYQNPILPVEDGDLCSRELQMAFGSVTGQQELWNPLSLNLVLPQSFDNIYLGETFTFYVCVHNESNQDVSDVLLKADVQTSSQRVNLPSKHQEPVAALRPEQSFGDVISHEVKEVGQHILVCAVSYNTPAGEKMYFRKFFKFPVTKPLDVRTKFCNTDADDVYLEAQIQNTTHAPIVLDRVSLETTDLYSAVELKAAEADSQERIFLKAQDTRQFLYCLSPSTSASAKSYRGVTNIGKLDMVWRSSMGERGRLQTSQLQRMAPGYGDVRLTVEQAPSSVQLQQVFRIACRLHNCSERVLDVQLTLEPSLQPALLWCSASGRHLGQVQANCSHDFSLALLPVAAGFQSISGIRLTDTFLKRTYEHDDVAQVFVSA